MTNKVKLTLEDTAILRAIARSFASQCHKEKAISLIAHLSVDAKIVANNMYFDNCSNDSYTRIAAWFIDAGRNDTILYRREK